MQMKLNSKIIENDYGMWLDTGSPHLIVETNNTDEIDVKSAGRSIRYNNFYKEEGVNVNFVEKVSDNVFKIRTYERVLKMKLKPAVPDLLHLLFV